MKNIIVAFIMGIFFNGMLYAQDTLKIYDLIVNISSKTNITLPSSPTSSVSPAVSDTAYLAAVFKINHPENTSQIYISIGTAQDGSEVKSDMINIVNQGGVYHMVSGNTDICRFWGLSTNYFIPILKTNLAQCNWLTIYAKDNTGNYSSKKYFKIH